LKAALSPIDGPRGASWPAEFDRRPVLAVRGEEY